MLFLAMLFLFRGSFGVAVSSSALGDGVLMRETEKRPLTVGDWSFEGVPDFAFGDFLADEGALGDAALTFGDFLAGEGVLAFGDLVFGLFTSSNSCGNPNIISHEQKKTERFFLLTPRFPPCFTLTKPIAEARLRSDCLGRATLRLRRGVAPFCRGELGGRRLSNSSGLRWPPNDTRFLIVIGLAEASISLFFAASISERWGKSLR